MLPEALYNNTSSQTNHRKEKMQIEKHMKIFLYFQLSNVYSAISKVKVVLGYSYLRSSIFGKKYKNVY